MTQNQVCIAIAALVRAMGNVGRNARRVTKYCAPDLVLKLTRQYPVDERASRATFLLTIGRPNVTERVFIKACVAAGEIFPVRKIQLTYWPKKKIRKEA